MYVNHDKDLAKQQSYLAQIEILRKQVRELDATSTEDFARQLETKLLREIDEESRFVAQVCRGGGFCVWEVRLICL